MEILPYPSLSGDSHPPPPLYYLGTVLEGGGFPNAQIPSFPTPHPLHTQARGASTHPALNSPGFFAYRPMANLLFPDRRGPVTSLPGLWPVSFRSSVASPRSGLRPPGTQGQGAAQRPICGREEHSTQLGRVLDKHRRLPEGLQASPSCFIHAYSARNCIFKTKAALPLPPALGLLPPLRNPQGRIRSAPPPSSRSRGTDHLPAAAGWDGET